MLLLLLLVLPVALVVTTTRHLPKLKRAHRVTRRTKKLILSALDRFFKLRPSMLTTLVLPGSSVPRCGCQLTREEGLQLVIVRMVCCCVTKVVDGHNFSPCSDCDLDEALARLEL